MNVCHEKPLVISVPSLNGVEPGHSLGPWFLRLRGHVRLARPTLTFDLVEPWGRGQGEGSGNGTGSPTG